MNERIKELAKQARLQPSMQWIVSCDHEAGTFETEPCWEEFEKFAELIVQECIKQAHSVGDLRGANSDMIFGADTAALKISKHFGVE